MTVRAEPFRHLPFLRGLPETDQHALLALSRVEDVKRDEFFYHAGDRAKRAYMLTRGRVKLVRYGPDGRAIILRFFEPGMPFGFVEALEGIARQNAAQAIEDCQALSWDATTFIHTVVSHHKIASNAMRLMAERIGVKWDRIEDLSTERAGHRIARAAATGAPPGSALNPRHHRPGAVTRGTRRTRRHYPVHCQPSPQQVETPGDDRPEAEEGRRSVAEALDRLC